MRGKRRPPEERVSCLAGPLPPCRVCREEAAGFHYGVNTCEACKGFFRRSLLRGGRYDCLNSDRCDVLANRRKSCPKCRYLRCLSVGMSKDAIKTGRYTCMKRSNDLEEIRQLAREGKIPRDLIHKRHVPERQTKLSSHQSSTYTSTRPPQNGRESHMEADISSAYSSPQSTASKKPVCPNTFDRRCSQSHENDRDIQISSSRRQARSKHLNHKNIPICPLKPESRNELRTDEIESCHPNKHCLQSGRPFSDNKPCPNSSEISENFTEDFLLPVQKPPSPLMCLLDNAETIADCNLKCDDFSVYKSSPISILTPHCYPMAQRDFTVQELDDAINFVTNMHRKHVRDFIDEPEEILQSRLDKCLFDCKLKEKIFGEMRTIERRDYDVVFRSTGIDVDGRLLKLTECISHVEDEVKILVTLCKALPEFRRMDMRNQLALLKGSFVMLLMIGYYKGYDSKTRMLVCRYRSFCSHDVAMWGVKHQKMMDILFEVADKLKAWSMTYAMHVCLKMVMLFNPDCVTGNDKRTVERISMKYHECLKLLLRRAYPTKTSQQLDKGIRDLISMLQYTSSYHFQHIRDMDILSYKPVSENKMYLELLDL